MLVIQFTSETPEEHSCGSQVLLTKVVSYLVKLINGTIVKRHIDYVRRRQSRDDIVITLKLFL